MTTRQRGESQFVAVPIGRQLDPRLGRIATHLRCADMLAFAYGVVWEMFILEQGDARTGRLRGYTAEDISRRLEYRGRPRRLVEALRRAGVLTSHKDGSFSHPFWQETITGRYARTRAEMRDYEREKKRIQRAAGRADGEISAGSVPALSLGTPRDIEGRPDMSPGSPGPVPRENGDQSIKVSPGHPPEPPAKRGELGKKRWEWMLEHHKRPTKPVACELLLDGLSEEEWLDVQFVTRDAAKLTPSSSRKKRVLGWDSFKLLSEAAFLQFRKERRADSAQAPAVPLAVEQAEKERVGQAGKRDWILELLRDATLPEGEKETRKAKWLQANPDEAEWLKGALSN